MDCALKIRGPILIVLTTKSYALTSDATGVANAVWPLQTETLVYLKSKHVIKAIVTDCTRAFSMGSYGAKGSKGPNGLF